MRGIRVDKRGSGATSEEQVDEWRKTERLEREAPNTSASSDPCVALEHPVSGEIQSRPGSALVQKSGDDDVRISALDAFCEKDGRRSRCIGEVLEWYRGEDAGKSQKMNWSRSGMFSRRTIFERNPKILTEDKS